jgi:hypothetical protein
MIEEGGAFSWDEARTYDGVYQVSTESTHRYRVIQNANLAKKGALTKDRGFDVLYRAMTSMGGGRDTLALYDAHFTNGNQWFMAVNLTSATTSNVF